MLGTGLPSDHRDLLFSYLVTRVEEPRRGRSQFSCGNDDGDLRSRPDEGPRLPVRCNISDLECGSTLLFDDDTQLPDPESHQVRVCVDEENDVADLRRDLILPEGLRDEVMNLVDENLVPPFGHPAVAFKL